MKDVGRFNMKSMYFAVSFLCVASTLVNADTPIELTILLDRHTFYRGEDVPVRVRWSNSTGERIEGVDLQIDLGGLIYSNRKIGGLDATQSGVSMLRIPSESLRPQTYKLIVTARAKDNVIGQAVETITLAGRPNPDRMPVWLWPHKSFLDQLSPFNERSRETLDWWYAHGFTEVAVGELLSDDVLHGLEYTMARGMNVCVLPNGGLRGGPEFNSDDDDVWFKTGGGEFLPVNGDGSRILNPFHPKVSAWQDRENERMMRRLSGYPHIRSAFFNSEIVDRLRVNQNESGKRAMTEKLGFAPGDVGVPRFIMPGVVADDDPRYSLLKYEFQGGNGLATANKRAADMIHRYRPDVMTITDPYRESTLLDGFPGIDVISSWTYTNPDPKLMLYAETLRAACRSTGQTPMSTVTLLNYPGELTPNESWTMMGPGRLAVTTWINLSRAPKILGYYFSSACDPFVSLEDDLVTPKKNVSEESLPPATYDMMQRLSDEVIRPYGGMIRRLEVSPRRVALLSSAASESYAEDERLLGYYPNMQVYHFYSVLAMAQIPADVLYDEHITRYGLDDYDVLVLPRCGVLTESVYREIIKFQKRGGLVIADQYLGADIPSVIKFNFDFTYRKGVAALAIAEGRGYSGWDDHLQPDSAGIETMDGVTALEDQRVMESYASQLRESLDGLLTRTYDSDMPTALLSMLNGSGGSYLVVVNDKRSYDTRVGKYRAVLGQIIAQDVEITISDWKHDTLVAYDMLTRQALNVEDEEGRFSFNIKLTDLGGTIVALYAKPIEDISVSVPEAIRQSQDVSIVIQMTDIDGIPPIGLQPVRVRLKDPQGRVNELSDYYCLENGYATMSFIPALNDMLGKWTLTIEDLTAGKVAESSFDVIVQSLSKKSDE